MKKQTVIPNGAPVAFRREGSTLLLVLFISAVLVSLALTVSVLARTRQRLAERTLTQLSLRDEAQRALAKTCWMLSADTNQVTALTEPWALETKENRRLLETKENRRLPDGVYVFIEDEAARLCFPECGEAAFLAYAGLFAPGKEAEMTEQAQLLWQWASEKGKAEKDHNGGTDEAETEEEALPLFAAEQLLDAPFTKNPERMGRLIRSLTVHTGGKINVNTVSRETLLAAVRGVGGTIVAAEQLWRRLQDARAKGFVFLSTEPGEARKLMALSPTMPGAGELDALRRLQPQLCVDSPCFRITVLVCRASRQFQLEALYNPQDSTFLRYRPQ